MRHKLFGGSCAGPTLGKATARFLTLVATLGATACSTNSTPTGVEDRGGTPAEAAGGAEPGGPVSTGGEGVGVDLSGGVTTRPGGGTCGDGIIERSEQCDDGNTDSGDGCSRICQIEANWDCPTEGEACTYLGVCGNGILTTNKVCDDSNTESDDGCSGDCQTVEPGYICRVPGKPCAPRCGDGMIIGYETCDDGNADSGDGCSSTCKIEPGFGCTGTPSTCEPTVCGNGDLETGEGCDDGNALPYDGCSPTCQIEPKCGTYDAQGNPTSAVGACETSCGDGILLRGVEECDDGNVLDGDGCSHTCEEEPGWTCTSAYDAPPAELDIPIVARDFESYEDGDPPSGHPDFGHYCCDDSLEKGQGVVAAALGLDRKPVWGGPTQVADPTQLLFTGEAEFDQWYRDVADVNMTFYEELTLLQSATDAATYAMNSDTDVPWNELCGFFPLDDLTKPLLDQNTGLQVTYEDGAFPGVTCQAYEGLGFGNSWANHNYSFTTELRYWFQYEGNENLQFTGDDDVWVFINGTLTVEMPGTHNRAVGNAVLDATNGTASITYSNNTALDTSVDLGLTQGDVYEVVVFQAERWCCGSNYMLTLANFLAGKSTCIPRCGDGVATGGEECDCGDGTAPVSAGCPGPNDDSTYGGCTTECTWGAFCGDGVAQSPPYGPEQCDLGKENGTADGQDSCSITCRQARFCGDGNVDSDLGEECDLGANNGLELDNDLQAVSEPGTGEILCTSDCFIPPGIVY